LGICLEREDWLKYFDQFDAKGTIVVVDQHAKSERILVFDNKRAHQRFSPASSFKIPHKEQKRTRTPMTKKSKQ